jgi:GT2 family glycosyltransferase
MSTTPDTQELDASIVIATYNRKDDTRRALESSFAQTANVEVIVMDDASDDGTAEMVIEEFPEARLYRSEEHLDATVQRNRGFRLAKAPVIISLDNDAAFSSPDIVDHTLKELDHPRIGVVAMPIRAEHSDDLQSIEAPGDDPYVTFGFMGCAAALRRDLFVSLGGYREAIGHQGEEEDYCIRMIGAGYVVKVGTAPVVDHFVSPKRDSTHSFYLGRRNQVMFVTDNIPWPYVALELPRTTVDCVRLGFKWNEKRAAMEGIRDGYRAALRRRHEREPVSRRAHRVMSWLKRQRILRLETVLPELPPLRGTD